MTTLTWDRHQGHAYTYDVTDLGYNYRIDEIRSALGLAQLRKLCGHNTRRKAITERYWCAFDKAGLGLPFRDAPGESAYHLFPILLPAGVARQVFIDHMRMEGVQTSIHYPPIHRFSYYIARYPGVSLPITEAVATAKSRYRCTQRCRMSRWTGLYRPSIGHWMMARRNLAARRRVNDVPSSRSMKLSPIEKSLVRLIVAGFPFDSAATTGLDNLLPSETEWRSIATCAHNTR